MSQYISETIYQLLTDVKNGKVILPAMQRNFVWETGRISKLFDSIMHSYPIGTLMFWKIDRNAFNAYSFCEFVRDYDEQKGAYQRGSKAQADLSEYEAVLDGQQRITSFYLGIYGSWRTHKRNTPWAKDSSYYMRSFCINILQDRKSEEDEYEFDFINDNDIAKPIVDKKRGKQFWVKVGDIIDVNSLKADAYMDSISETFADEFPAKIANAARQVLRKLNNQLCVVDNIHYYPAKDMSLAQVGEVFVRVNNGGQKLSYCDLLLSIATSDLEGKDIHEKIEEKIQYINAKADFETGFKVDTELILSAGLYFTNAESLSLKDPKNYEKATMSSIFDTNWESITEALAAAVAYLEYLGFVGSRLTSKNLLLPIAYYFYVTGVSIEKEKGQNARAVCDFIFIRQWLLRAMINSLFSDAINSTLVRIRGHIFSTSKFFPLNALMANELKKGKDLQIDVDQIDGILEYKKGDARVCPLLMEIAKISVCRKYDEDHIWPQSTVCSEKAIRKRFPNISNAEVAEYLKEYDRIGNIELLDPGVNKSKSDTPYGEWLSKNPQNSSYYSDNCIPTEMSYGYEDFIEFVTRRKELLKDAILIAFPNDFDQIVNRYSLEKKIQ